MRFVLVSVVLLARTAAALAGHEWRSFPDEKGELALWQDGVQLGNYRLSEKRYYPHLAPGVWGDPCPPPYPPPPELLAPGKIESDGTLNFGLERARLAAKQQHLLNGKGSARRSCCKPWARPACPMTAAGSP